jgi:hypothetical protein
MLEKFKKTAKEVAGKLKKVDAQEAEQIQKQGMTVAQKAKLIQEQAKQGKPELKKVVEAKEESKKFLGIFKRATKK